MFTLLCLRYEQCEHKGMNLIRTINAMSMLLTMSKQYGQYHDEYNLNDITQRLRLFKQHQHDVDTILVQNMIRMLTM